VSALAGALAALTAGRDLTADEAHAAVAQIIDGQATEATIAALLTGLKVKGETPDELCGAVRAVRERMTPLEVPESCRPLLDTCGTGGDGACTVNVSTAAAIVAAACGVRVAKHGNRAASGNSGSAEVLAELGIHIEAGPPGLVRCLEEAGIAFLFAPRFHPALRHAGPVRKQLPFRTLFNLIGPLANPARPEYQLIGVPSCDLVRLVTTALAALDGPRGGRAAVVCGDGRLDEVTPSAATLVGWVVPGDHRIDDRGWIPADFGLGPVDPAALRVHGPADSAARIRALLDGERGPVRDVVLANAAAALYIGGRASGLAEGVARAAEAIDTGAAARRLETWSRLSREP
jgi:anthranilate phosphoribosyltransferase